MALENYRITEFQEKTQVDNGDYVLIDSATDGTHKYQLSRIPAQASAEVAAAVASEAAAREAADSTLDGKIGTLSNLTTDAKGSLVAAVNEVDAHADANTSALSDKVDKVAGKGLSKNDFTDALKAKLDGIEAGAEVNDVTSVAGKTGAVALGGGDVSYNEETTYADGTVGKGLTDLKSDLTLLEADLEGESEIRESISFVYGYYINLRDGTTVDISTPVANQGYKYAIVDCSAGDKFLINAYGGSAPRAYGFIDSSNTKLYVSDADTNVLNQTVTAPANSAKIIINDRFSDSSDLMSYKIVETEGIGDNFVRFDKAQTKTDAEKELARRNIGIDEIPDGISDEVKDALLACFRHVVWLDEQGQTYYDALAEALYPYRPEPFSYGVYEPESIVNGKYINDQGAVVDGEANKSYYIEDYIPVVRSSYWIGYQPPHIIQQWHGDYDIARSISNWRVSEYDVSKNFIKQTQFSVSSPNQQYSSSIITFDQTTKYIRLGWYDTDGGVHEFDIENPASLVALPMESGDINSSTGQDSENNLRIRTIDYLEVVNESLTLTGCPFASSWPEFETSPGNHSGFYLARCYDTSKNYLGSTAVFKDNTVNEALPSGTKYIRLMMTYGLIEFTEFKYLVSYPITINGARYYVSESE